jgi:cell division protein FtsB
MDDLERKIVELEEKNKELEGENNKLARKISRDENVIYKIIKDAIEKIVKGESNDLNKFKEESLIKISEIITDKKAYNKQRTDIDTKNELLYHKIKEYIITYINKNEDKVISYSKIGDVGNAKYGPLYTYIYYIKNTDEIKIYTASNIQTKAEIKLNKAKLVELADLREIYQYIYNGEISTINT